MAISVASPPRIRGLGRPLTVVVKAALALEQRVPGEIAIVLAGDAELRELNRRWRRIDRATDVLSFGYEDGPVARRVSGDLVISMARCDEQARRYRVSRGRELARLVVHGTLHLAGLDHDRVAERRHMRAQEERAMRALRPEIKALDAALSSGAAVDARAHIGDSRRRRAPVRSRSAATPS